MDEDSVTSVNKLRHLISTTEVRPITSLRLGAFANGMADSSERKAKVDDPQLLAPGAYIITFLEERHHNGRLPGAKLLPTDW